MLHDDKAQAKPLEIKDEAITVYFDFDIEARKRGSTSLIKTTHCVCEHIIKWDFLKDYSKN